MPYFQESLVIFPMFHGEQNHKRKNDALFQYFTNDLVVEDEDVFMRMFWNYIKDLAKNEMGNFLLIP